MVQNGAVSRPPDFLVSRYASSAGREVENRNALLLARIGLNHILRSPQAILCAPFVYLAFFAVDQGAQRVRKETKVKTRTLATGASLLVRSLLQQ
jgi:hypothetical protein